MPDNVYSKKIITELLKTYGASPSKKRGQNFLCDKNTAEKIACFIPNGFNRSESAIEIGGGFGSLTNVLEKIYSNNLTVIEYDKKLFSFLSEEYKNKINIIHNDILNIKLNDNINKKTDVYGNIPYNIASPIMDWLLYDSAGKWNYAVFMVQTDFALRLTAKEGTKDYSSLTVFCSFLAETSLEFNVSRNVFYPTPNVDSSVISIKPKEFDYSMIDIYKSLSKALFHNRRKNIKNNLLHSPYLKTEPKEVETILELLNIDKNERGENLSPHIIKSIAEKLKNI